MKVVSILSPIKFGGGEKLLIEQGRWFRKIGVEYMIVNLTRSEEFERYLDKEDIKYVNVTDVVFKQTPTKKDYLTLLLRIMGTVPKIRKILLKEQPDVIVSNGFPAFVLVPASLAMCRSKPKLFYVHHSLKTKERWIVKNIYQFFLRRYEKIIGVSSSTADSLKKVFPLLADKICYITNGIDTEVFNINYDKTSIRLKLDFPKEGVVALSVGRLTKLKNHAFLIRLAKEIDRRDFYIYIVGDGDEYQTLQEEISREKLEGRVKLIGFVPQELLPLYYKASDLFIYPSLHEGFGLVVLEAMASGLPTVIFDSIYVKEFGDNICIAKSEQEFVEYTRILVNDELRRRQVGEAVMKDAKELDIRKTVERYLKLFEGRN
ncbi:glycosyltransferase family 4 protein [Fervidobacterium sp.]